ncbi:MAG TPA: tripartite tricarboxylate transporter substrate binding protein [Bordetella sp.]|jgi:tripartite-type tricarboxylate transporter receptor subunit TctC|nr:tripartite tricarboxylate transporter substrate binding protein [Bordetella sp.]
MTQPHHAGTARRAFLSFSATLCTGVFALAAGSAAAASYPDHQITLVVPYAPGGGVDSVGRILSRGLSKELNQSVVVENRPGAGATVGAGYVKRAAADGYTMMVVDPALIINPSLMANLPYDALRDFTAVSMLTVSPLMLSVTNSLPAKSVADLQGLAKSGTQGLSFASAGIGTTPHMAGELFKLKTQGNFTHVPYKGSGPAMTDLISGQVQFSFSTIAAASPFVTTGKIRALATTGDKRSPDWPQLPTVAETLPGFKVLFWTGLFVPSQTPPDVVRKLNEAVTKVWQSSEAQDALKKIGETPAPPMTSPQSQEFVQSESKMWATVVKDANIKLD